MRDLKQKQLRIAVTGASELGQRLEACSRCIAELQSAFKKLQEAWIGITVQSERSTYEKP